VLHCFITITQGLFNTHFWMDRSFCPNKNLAFIRFFIAAVRLVSFFLLVWGTLIDRGLKLISVSKFYFRKFVCLKLYCFGKFWAVNVTGVSSMQFRYYWALFSSIIGCAGVSMRAKNLFSKFIWSFWTELISRHLHYHSPALFFFMLPPDGLFVKSPSLHVLVDVRNLLHL